MLLSVILVYKNYSCSTTETVNYVTLLLIIVCIDVAVIVIIAIYEQAWPSAVLALCHVAEWNLQPITSLTFATVMHLHVHSYTYSYTYTMLKVLCGHVFP